MRCTGLESRMDTMENAYKTVVGNREGKQPSGRTGHGRCFKNWGMRMWTGRDASGGGSYQYGDGLSDSING